MVASLTISNSSFLYQYDVTPSRLANSIRLFGYSPRVCFAVATGPRRATDALNRLELAVWQVPDISTALLSCRNGSSVDDTVFEVIPKDEQRLLDCAVVRPVSLLALDILLHDKAKRSNQSVYDIYSELRPLPEVAAFIGMTREHVLHRYLRQVQGDFELTPLHPSHPPYTLHLPKLFHIHATCSTDAAFRSSSTLSKTFDSDGSVSQSCYAYPDFPDLATFDSVASVDSDFLCFQTAMGATHRMKLLGLQRAQRLKIGTPLEKFRLGKDNRWKVIFVVPSTLKGSFSLQSEAFASPQETKAQTLTPISEEGCSKRQKNGEDPVIANPDIGDTGNVESSLYQYVWFVEEKDVFTAYAAYLDFEGASPTNRYI